MTINEEAFRYIELMGKAGVTATELAEKLLLAQGTCQTWLSKWTKLRYLKHTPFKGHVPYTDIRSSKGGRPKGSAGRYMIGDKWWGDRTLMGVDE